MKNSKVLIGVGIAGGCVLLVLGLVVAMVVGVYLAIGEKPAPQPPLQLEPAAGCPVGQVPDANAPGLVLPDITGLAGSDSAGPDAPATGGAADVVRLTVLVEASGKARIEGQDSVGAWRGTNLPCDVGPAAEASQDKDQLLDEVVIHVSSKEGGAGFEYRIREFKTNDLRDLNGHLAQLAQVGRMPMVIDPKPDVPFGAVAGAIAAATERDFPIEFRPPPAKDEGPAPRDPALKNEILRRAVERTGPDGLSTLGVRIRADSRVPWSSVAVVLMACMDAKVWRVAFSAMRDGQEVTVGRTGAPTRTPVRAERPVVIHEKLEKKDLFRPPTVEEAPIIGEEPAVEPKEDVPGIPPIGGVGIGVGGGGMAGCFGFRDGGGRKRAAARFGGSPATESAVEAALRWLARHQRADGSWTGEVSAIEAMVPAPAKITPEEQAELAGLARQLGDKDFARREAATKALLAKGLAARGTLEEAAKSSDLEVRERAGRILAEMTSGGRERAAIGGKGVTALALLAFLSAGYTDKQGRYRDNAGRALGWLIKQQGPDGSLGEGADHALAGLALAEVFGMSGNGAAGKAAQKAVDRSLAIQKQYSGWPKDRPDLAVTGWFVLQLKSAKVAGLRVDGVGFQGALAFIEKVTSAEGRAAQAPGKPSSPAMTAMGMWCRQLVGAPRDDPALVKAAENLAKDLPDSLGKGELGYWHFGTLAMFQTGGESWKTWNEAMKKTLLEGQRKGGPLDGSDQDVDGSWEEKTGGEAPGSRVYATALGALCLEVYYRYLPMYTK